MNKKVLSALALTPACIPAGAQTTGTQAPHIVIFLCDDMGFSDIGCYGGEVETPNIDLLGEQGCRFTHFTVAGRSCPSRASLMTGYYAHEAGMGWMTAVDEHRDGYRGQISSEIPTLAEVMKENGYSTYMSGKWHLTLDNSYDNGPNGSHPIQRGFDRYYGSMAGNAGYYTPTDMYADLTRVTSFPDDYYYTTAITDSAVSFINQHAADTPMFLYVAHQAPHLPLAAPSDRVEKCKPRYEAGYDVLRQARFDKQKEMGIIPDSLDLPTFDSDYSGSFPTWESLSSSNQQQWVNDMATYAAMIEILDDGVGEIIQILREKGMLDNTVFFFLSDNGATDEGGYVGKLMSSLSNTPFRSFKAKCYNGGTCSPLIVSYGDPEKESKTNARWTEMDGQWTDQQAHLIDILPTCVDMADGTYPTTYKNGEALPGISLVPALEGEEPQDREIYFEHQGSCAVISGDWKLVRDTKSASWELIDLINDPFELSNVSSSNSSTTSSLETAWDTWATETNVYPLEDMSWSQRISYYTSLNPDQDGIDEEVKPDSLFISSIGERVSEHGGFADTVLYAIKNVGVPGTETTNTSYQGWLYIDTYNNMRIAGGSDTEAIGLSERHTFTIETVDASAGTYRFRTANGRYINAYGTSQNIVSWTLDAANAVYTLTKNQRDEVKDLDAWYFTTVNNLRIKPNNGNSLYSSDYIIFDGGQPQLNSWYIYPVTLEWGEEEVTEPVLLPDGQYAITGWKTDGSTTPGLVYYDPTLSSRLYRIDADVQYTEGEMPEDKYVWTLANDETTNTFTLQNLAHGVYIPANSSNGQNFSGTITANLQLVETEMTGSDGSPVYYVTMTNYSGTGGTVPYWFINTPAGDPNLNWYYATDAASGAASCKVTFHALSDSEDGDDGDGNEDGDGEDGTLVGIDAVTETGDTRKFYDLQGRHVSNPTKGIYIVKTGTQTRKVYIGE